MFHGTTTHSDHVPTRMFAPAPPQCPARVLARAACRRAAVGCLLVLVLAVEPAAAQESAVCEVDRLPGMISGFFQLTTALGLLGLVIVWQADSLIELFTFRPERREGVKRHKWTALRSAVILVVLGPLYTVAGSVMNLPLAECVELTPW